jgi:sodium-dependent dicarboxylate transporter 2/3/5
MSEIETTTTGPSRFRLLALMAGPVIYILLLWLAPSGLNREAQHVLATAGWMATWWMLEPVPLAATSLLPIALFPLTGVATTREAVGPFANELVFLFLAGFLLAAALETWNAHARIAYAMVSAIGFSGKRVVLGVMVATAVISMWISNTATAAMMYPIALAIGALFGASKDARKLRTALMLGVAYAASIGGMGTLLGTPPNLVLAGSARQLTGQDVTFTQFAMFGMPMVIILLPLCWLLLVFVLFRARVELEGDARGILQDRRTALGPLLGGERAALVVFGLTALAWVLRERKDFGLFTIPGIVDFAPRVTDASVGITGALLLFLFTARDRDGITRPLLSWREARAIPWDVLLLFGGGLSLAAAMEATGLAKWLGESMTVLQGAPPFAIYLGLAVIVLVLSELASNTAVSTMAMPIAASLAHAVGQPPILLMYVAAFAASTGFALPIATPPNTIVFGSGQVTVRQMARAGILLDAVAIIVIVTVISILAPLLLP